LADGRSARDRATAQRWFLEGVRLHGQDQFIEAEAHYRKALELDRDNVGALHLSGLIAATTGRREQALDLLSRAVAANATLPAIHSDLGLLLNDLGRPADALVRFETAVALKPDFHTAWFNRGIALKALGRLDDAVDSYDRAVALRPDFADAHANRGSALREAGRTQEALASLDRAVALEPGLAEAHGARCLILADLGRQNEALAAADRFVALRPRDPDAHIDRGNVLRDMGRFDEAIVAYDGAIALDPACADAHGNRGNALHELGRSAEALPSIDAAIGLRPGHAPSRGNRALALSALWRFEEAMASFDDAIRLDPDYADAAWNKALLALLLGDFGQGWAFYEARKRMKAYQPPAIGDRPPWTGEQDVTGRSVFLHWEQGLGDTLQFCRFAPRVLERGARVVMSVQAPLLRLMRQFEPGIDVIGPAETPAQFDYHCSLMSLPHVLGVTADALASPGSYLTGDPELIAAWRARLPDGGRPRTGLAWSGNPAHRHDRIRSTPLGELEPLLSADADWICLQTDFRDGDAAMMREFGVLAPDKEELSDFADTAAIVSQLDLVISVDTSVAHLAGALGKPVWIMLPHLPDFRWLLERGDSPWYPSARLFRQPRPGDWASVIDRVRTELGR
jgi:tetratricopeptide (TPR) repeat protein